MIFTIPIHTLCATTGLWLLACTALQAESAAELIKRGDGYAAKLETTEALACYLPAEKLEPKNAHILVRIAREHRHLMTEAPKLKDKLKLGGTALDYSLRAAALAPADSEAQIAPAITYGKMLSIMGSKQQFEASRQIKVAADKAIKLDPGNDVAWHVLGRWHQALANISVFKSVFAPILYGELPTTTNEEAVKCFERAIKINPTRLMNYIELGRTYALMGRNADARRMLSKGLAMPNMENDDPEIKVRGREALAKLPS